VLYAKIESLLLMVNTYKRGRNNMFRGSIVAIVTPFKKGQVDEETLRDLVEFHIQNGTNGIVPCGTTGESATLSFDEHKQVVKIVVEAVRKRVPVIAGAGSNNTKEAIELTRWAKDVGADAVLSITPYYNKPTPAGLYAHFKAISDAVPIPIVIYNVPGRTGINMPPHVVEKISSVEHMVAIKEASGDLRQVTGIIERCGDRITVLSGDDFTILPLLSVGGKGVISVVANVLPTDVANLVKKFEDKNIQAAASLQLKLFPLCEAMFMETNPIPVKTALSLMGKIDGELRLPLCAMKEENVSTLKSVLASYNLI
jgi:4-hydroxy-tetrahydrodipicolinate synthase